MIKSTYLEWAFLRGSLHYTVLTDAIKSIYINIKLYLHKFKDQHYGTVEGKSIFLFNQKDNIFTTTNFQPTGYKILQYFQIQFVFQCSSFLLHLLLSLDQDLSNKQKNTLTIIFTS